MANYNVKQITGYDVLDNPTFTYTITVPHRTPSGEIEFISEDVEYVQVIANVDVIKLGYCCEPKAFIYPIFLKMHDTYHQIQIGKDGMYEMQPEDWKDVNAEEVKEKTSNVIVSGVRVPKNVNFTLDYVLNIN